MQIKLILLDFDGTLATTEEANMMAYALALKEEGIELDLAEYKRHYFGMRCPEFLNDIGITDPEQMKAIRRRKVEIYPTHFDMVTLNKPLWDFVQMFRSNGGKAMIVSTGHIDNITNAMRYLGIEKEVDGILSAHDVERSKPAPDCFLKAMDIVGVTPAETIIFEDSVYGLQSAKDSGATFVQIKL